MTADESGKLDLARDQLEVIAKVVSSTQRVPKETVGRIQLGFGKAYEALSAVAGYSARVAEGGSP